MRRRGWLVSALVVGMFMLMPIGTALTAADRANQELLYPGEDFAKLDTFEALNLEDADKLFIKKDWPGAYTAYKAYSFEFAQGKALPYVLLRMGRCLHQLDKRNTAIKAYQDVVDYFPDDVPYAAAALYYMGECHAQNGNEAKSLAVWARLVKDKEYVAQPRSGTALASLAAAMEKRGDFEEAVSYCWRTAVAFRTSNESAAATARAKVIHHYVVRSPNQPKLLQFCNEAGGFGWRHTIAKPELDAQYWSHICSTALRATLEPEQKKTVCQYWVGQLGDRFVENDSLRVALFALQRVVEADSTKWAKRMDEQFNRQPVTLDRVKQWFSHYASDRKVRSAFFTKYALPLVAGLKNDEKISLMKSLRHPYGMNEEVVVVMRAVRTDGMSDAAIRDLALFAASYEGEETVMLYIGKIQNKTLAAKTRFDYYYARAFRNGPFQEKALAEIPALRQSPEYAQELGWARAVLLQWQGQLEEAIKAYQATNREPDATWAIIDCQVALKQYGPAIKLARELEGVGGAVASRACLKGADICRTMGDKGKEVQQLQLVLRRYPKSGESSTAHGRLESYGVKVIGGEATAEE